MAELQEPTLEEENADIEDVAFTGLSDEQISFVVEHLDEGSPRDLEDFLNELGPADFAELIEKLDMQHRVLFVETFADVIPPETFSHLEFDLRQSVLGKMPALAVARIVNDLESDDALDLVLSLDDDEFRTDVVQKLSYKVRAHVEEGLTFPEDSAGRLMQREFVAIPQFWTVGKTIDYLRAAGQTLPQDFLDLFVVTPSYHVVGEVPLNRLVCAQRSEKIESLARSDIHAISADTDQEEVAMIFRREGLSSVPVIDSSDRLIGVITVDDVIDVIDEEAEEDILKLAGVEDDDIHRSLWSTTYSRFRWLFINLFTAVLASYVISFFEAAIDKVVALAVLMPIVASMGGNAGTQVMTVAVRALATKDLTFGNAYRLLSKEVLVGLLNGVAFAIIAGCVTWFWFKDPLLGIVISFAMVTNLVAAGFSGVAIPLVLQRMGADPAVSSTVFLTTVTDVVGFFVFLGLAAIVLL
ncbi:MAG: magnesium transporter [Alphaproteobacteria bacterium]|nr:magnesium transporter [Alphaproteobacteria bacterium]